MYDLDLHSYNWTTIKTQNWIPNKIRSEIWTKEYRKQRHSHYLVHRRKNPRPLGKMHRNWWAWGMSSNWSPQTQSLPALHTNCMSKCPKKKKKKRTTMVKKTTSSQHRIPNLYRVPLSTWHVAESALDDPIDSSIKTENVKFTFLKDSLLNRYKEKWEIGIELYLELGYGRKSMRRNRRATRCRSKWSRRWRHVEEARNHVSQL